MLRIINCSVQTHDYHHLIGREVTIIDEDTFMLESTDCSWRLVICDDIPYIIASIDLISIEDSYKSNISYIDYSGFNEYIN